MHGTVRAVRVLGSDVPLGEGSLCLHIVNRRVWLRFRFLESCSDGSGSAFQFLEKAVPTVLVSGLRCLDVRLHPLHPTNEAHASGIREFHSIWFLPCGSGTTAVEADGSVRGPPGANMV